MKWLREFLRRLLATYLQDKEATPAPEEKVEPGPTVEPTPAPTPSTGDAIDLANWSVGCKNCPGVTPEKIRRAPVTAKLKEAWTNGEKLYTVYDPYSWPARGGDLRADGTTSKRIDAIVFFGYGGRIEKFDYWAAGGQIDKTLENVVKGPYDTLTMPARGTKCYAMICSLDGAQRSNVVEVGWK